MNHYAATPGAHHGAHESRAARAAAVDSSPLQKDMLAEYRATPSRMPGFDETAFGVYVHWPFCLAKCPYCDFNSHVRGTQIDERRFLAAYRQEIAHRAALKPKAKVTSLFFGGGTPSLMNPATVASIIDAVKAHWPVAQDAEITLEANPTSVEASRFAGFRDAGINRVSLGIQALDDADLKALGRRHSAQEALRALEIAQTHFNRVSCDFIYARMGQTPKSWEKELKQALSLGIEHLSLYQLTIEPDTMFEKLHQAGKLAMPDDARARALWDMTQELCAGAGMAAYEISNHARDGAQSRHNLTYWRCQDYVGIGPGAHGRVTTANGRYAQRTESHPEMWRSIVEIEGHGLIGEEQLSFQEQGDELLLMGLRLSEGIDLERYAKLGGREISQTRFALLQAQGMVEEVAPGKIRASAAGLPLLDFIVADLAA